ncbi:MAG: SDR family NAD(P)-dependent oxidoreductase [bacterium]|nr:SDR family NAD(P)-dependent oxidoreductase [bacterium]
MQNPFKGKTILVTGGTGSIGSEIVRQLLKKGPKVIRVFSRHEEGHHQLMLELAAFQPLVRFIIGDIRDKDRLALAMEGVDIVFHAAAMKHVPLCESNPFEAVKTNIIGTQNLIEVARSANVEHVIGISTDKAAEPESVLGTSKLMAEKLFLATYFYKGNKRTTFTCVRFGNVLGSRGSILPLLKKQIVERGEVTVTDSNMTRFVMTIPQAVNLVLSAVALSRGQEIFILKMSSAKLGDIVDAAIAHFAPQAGKKPSDIRIRVIGKRAGEKLHERLLAEHELARVLETKEMYILTPNETVGLQEYTPVYQGAVPGASTTYYSSEFAPKLSLEELSALIAQVDSPVCAEKGKETVSKKRKKA